MDLVNSIVKATRVVDLLRHRGQSSFSEILAELDLPKSTLHKILATLEAEEILRRDHDSGRYHLGVKLIEWGSGARAQLEVRAIALPLLQELSEALNCTIHLTVLSHGQVVPIESFESGSKTWPQYIFHGGVGIPAPLHATAAGKAILAHLPREESAVLLDGVHLEKFTRNTITDPARLAAALSTIRRRGYAVSDGEHFEMVRGVAAPVFDHDGRAIASVSALGVAARLTPEWIPDVAAGVVRTAGEISRQLGYQPGDRRAVRPLSRAAR